MAEAEESDVGGSGLDAVGDIREMYRYDSAGLLLGKRLWMGTNGASDALDASYTYDSEGKMVTQTYPTAQPTGGGADVAGESFAYGFDAMGRPSSMNSNAGATNWISGVTYNEAGLPTAITAGNSSVAGETRTYSVLGPRR